MKKKIIEADYKSTRVTFFANFYADSLFIYYIVTAGGVRKSDRRKVKR